MLCRFAPYIIYNYSREQPFQAEGLNSRKDKQ